MKRLKLMLRIHLRFVKLREQVIRLPYLQQQQIVRLYSGESLLQTLEY